MKYLIILLLLFTPALLTSEELLKEEVKYKEGDTTLIGTLIRKKGVEKAPGILLFHEWWGKNEYVLRRGEEYAKLGYLVFVADMFGEGRVTKDPKEAGSFASPFYEDRTLAKRRGNAALRELKNSSFLEGERVAAVGYCFGGSMALELGRSGAPLFGTVVFHGGLGTPNLDENASIKGAVLILNGASDPFISEKEKEEFKNSLSKGGVSYTFMEYEDALHAFSNPEADKAGVEGAGYNERADKLSFEESKKFLAEVLKVSNPKKVI